MSSTANAARANPAESGFIYLGGSSASPQGINLRYANRHGLIAGATGTGKTVTLQAMAEGFSRAGVPVFMADVKGDLTGISQAGGANARIEERLKILSISDFEFAACPAIVWDVFGTQGHPLRTTISEMGPLLLSRLLNLSGAQEGVLQIAFAVADDEGMLLLDLKDLRAMLNHISEHTEEYKEYGLISKASVGAVLRNLLELEQQGAEKFFGEPALDISDLMRTNAKGQGMVNILAADVLINSPKLYATFLLWMLSELFENLPEAGDLDKPKLVFFFDEAHLLFNDAPKALVDKVEQVVRLIRSKGVGIYFVTQNPMDIPQDILGQLGNRVQHALRAFTPQDQKAVKVAAETFRPNPALDTAQVITELAVGEALVSTLEQGGAPSIVQRTLICPPSSRLGPVTQQERKSIRENSPCTSYERAEDRESAYEKLQVKSQSSEQTEIPRTEQPRYKAVGYQRQSTTEAIVKNVARAAASSVGRQIGNAIIRGVLGSIFKR
jgi:DNA helicase HerA-like ATPase